MLSIALVLRAALLLGLATGTHAQAPAVDSIAYDVAKDVQVRRAPRSSDDPRRFAPPMSIVLNPLDTDALLAEDARTPPGSPLRVGVVREFAPVGASDGMWSPLDDGGWIWTVDFDVPGATGVRLHVRGFEATNSGELRVLDLEEPEDFVGPFHADTPGPFWTPTLRAQRIRVEYEIPNGAALRQEDPTFTIDAILHRYGGEAAEGGPGVNPLPCHLDVSCYPEWLLEANGVGRLFYIDAGYGFLCSGALLNRVPGDFTPLLATANHCGITASNVGSLEVTWFYRSSTCNGSVLGWWTLPTSRGVARLVMDSSTDYALVGLDESLPNGATLLGWDSGYWGNGSPGIFIHHPLGSHQRISFGTKWENLTSCVGGDSWRVRLLDGDGEVEPGSSGSPILDVAGRVRGTHSCGDEEPECGEDNGSKDGRFDLAYPMLAPYLNPVDPIYVNDSYSGVESGTSIQPFNTLTEASFAVIAGSTIWLAPGIYSETPALTKPMFLCTTGGDAVIGI